MDYLRSFDKWLDDSNLRKRLSSVNVLSRFKKKLALYLSTVTSIVMKCATIILPTVRPDAHVNVIGYINSGTFPNSM